MTKYLFFACTLLLMFTACSSDKIADTPPLEHQYLGQSPPGLKPEIFAPGIISLDTTSDRDVSFSPDLREMYFSRDSRIMVTKFVDTGWTEPEPAPFSADYNEFETFITLDNKRAYFISMRPLSGSGEPEQFQIWYSDREKKGWTEPKRFSDRGDFYPTLTKDGIMYMTGADNNIYMLDLNDKSAEPVKLDESINTPAPEYNSYIAPDGSYLIFSSFGWGDGFGRGDLFISFRSPAGIWSRPKNMGPGINSSAHDYCPSVSPDGKYLFFASNIHGRNDIFWVDAKIINVLKTRNLNLADMLYDAIISNGMETFAQAYGEIYNTYGDYTDFDGDLLRSVADRLLIAKKITESIDMMAFSLIEYPDNQTMSQQLKYVVLYNDPKMRADVFNELKARDDLTAAHEIEINALGYFFLQNNLIDPATTVFKLNTELFPDASNVYDSYGEALLMQFDTAKAIVNYKKSLELNPDNQNAVEVLKIIE